MVWNKLFIGILALSFGSKSVAQNDFVWAKSMGGTGVDSGESSAVDAAGNIYTAGSFQSTANFGHGLGAINLTTMGFTDIFISKTDPNGNTIWAKSIGGTGYDAAHGITTDMAGNIYLTGYYEKTVDFDPGTGVFNLTTAPILDRNCFVLKLDA